MKQEKNKLDAPDKVQLDRRQAIKKAGFIALSAATLMLLMKSQPASAESPGDAPFYDEGDFG